MCRARKGPAVVCREHGMRRGHTAGVLCTKEAVSSSEGVTPRSRLVTRKAGRGRSNAGLGSTRRRVGAGQQSGEVYMQQEQEVPSGQVHESAQEMDSSQQERLHYPKERRMTFSLDRVNLSRTPLTRRHPGGLTGRLGAPSLDFVGSAMTFPSIDHSEKLSAPSLPLPCCLVEHA